MIVVMIESGRGDSLGSRDSLRSWAMVGACDRGGWVAVDLGGLARRRWLRGPCAVGKGCWTLWTVVLERGMSEFFDVQNRKT